MLKIDYFFHENIVSLSKETAGQQLCDRIPEISGISKDTDIKGDIVFIKDDGNLLGSLCIANKGKASFFHVGQELAVFDYDHSTFVEAFTQFLNTL